MYNLLILGSGRSGTSLAAGLFRNAGYFMGDNLWNGDSGNPKGYFEDEQINHLNSEILSSVLPRRPNGRLGSLPFFRARLGNEHTWLARIPLGTKLSCSNGTIKQIESLSKRQPFCYKDPRFSYTLPCWRPFLHNTRFLVVFRSPAHTAMSILRECKEKLYLKGLSINREKILESWRLIYLHILSYHNPGGDWLFLHYDQLLDDKWLGLLERFAEAPLDRGFPDRNLKRSTSNEPVPADVLEIYGKLQGLAGYRN